jgi:hypothetical protein
VETLTHGFAAEAGEAIPSSTVTGRGDSEPYIRPQPRQKSEVVLPPPLSAGVRLPEVPCFLAWLSYNQPRKGEHYVT